MMRRVFFLSGASRTWVWWVLRVSLAISPLPAMAVDGVIELSQACASGPGCFPGDGPGFPIEIGTSGSYRLTSNLDLAAGTPDLDLSAIVLSASDVTLDLNGFAVIGPALCGSACPPVENGNAIGIDGASARSLQVRDGSVRGFPKHGIILGALSRVSDLNVSETGNLGIRVGPGSIVARCNVILTGGRGIEAESRSVVIQNTTQGTGGFGISAYSESIIAENRLFGSNNDLIDALSANVVRNNDLHAPQLIGIDVGTDSVLIGNALYGIPGAALSMGAGSAYAENHVASGGAPSGGTAIACNNLNGVVTCPP